MKTVAQTFIGLAIFVFVFAAGFLTSQEIDNKDIGRFKYVGKGLFIDSKTGSVSYVKDSHYRRVLTR